MSTVVLKLLAIHNMAVKKVANIELAFKTHIPVTASNKSMSEVFDMIGSAIKGVGATLDSAVSAVDIIGVTKVARSLVNFTASTVDNVTEIGESVTDNVIDIADTVTDVTTGTIENVAEGLFSLNKLFTNPVFFVVIGVVGLVVVGFILWKTGVLDNLFSKKNTVTEEYEDSPSTLDTQDAQNTMYEPRGDYEM